jgi:IS5 family transposase
MECFAGETSPQTLLKQKRHTLKAQVVIEQSQGLIVCSAFAKGRCHDFRLFKQAGMPLAHTQLCLADKGYQGIARVHAHSAIPIKKRRKTKLSHPERAHNRCLASIRVKVEHIIRRLKVFRILSERYRNRKKRFGLRFNLIAALVNEELKLRS